MVKRFDVPMDKNIVKVALEEVMPDNYLPYAVEVAKDRALPDVRDGLKPVHRRILYGAYMLKAMPDKPYYKSARIVGDILGKYHPHGDTSVYDAMVILAQNFSTRLPLIDGHGNWGSVDGDNAAAMRYTEARLSKASLEMLRDIDKDVVDMVENYSGSEFEPSVLPARYPNLLVNGSFGIAVGLSTNIPPHNLKEVIAATLAYIDNNDITTSQLMDYIKGPDLPTGGIIIGKNSLLSAYETGEGKVTLRSKAKIEKLDTGRLGIVITEFPYKRSKAKLLQLISEMTEDKRHSKALEAITDIRDESDRDGIRAVIEFRKSADSETADRVLKYLLKKTDLQCNVIFNIVAIADGKPETLGLKSILRYYVNHQKIIIKRRTENELSVAEKRYHIIEGFIKAIDIMDEIIKIIRGSKSKRDASINLVQNFSFSELQAEAILELMLYRLTGLEIKAYEKEHKELEIVINKLKKILANESILLKVIKDELSEIAEKYGDARRTEIIENDEEAKIDVIELSYAEDIMVAVSKEGYAKSVLQKSYNRSNTDTKDIEYREGDSLKWLFNSNTMDTILFFTDKGNMYQLKGSAVPEYKWKDKGLRLDEIIKTLDLGLEKLVSAFNINSFQDTKYMLLFTSNGYMKRTNLSSFNTNYTKLQAVKLRDKEKLVDVVIGDSSRLEQFINIKTKLDMNFTIEEPVLTETERMIIGTPLVNISVKDEITEVSYTSEYHYKSFIITGDAKGNIKALKEDERSKKDIIKCYTNSASKLLLFFDDGRVIKLSSVIFEDYTNKEINIEDLSDGFDMKKLKLLNILSVSSFQDENDIYFISSGGLVKRTEVKEFDGDYNVTIGYKLKNSEDKLVDVVYSNNSEEKELILITSKAMCIRFNASDINKTGRVTSGVNGIALKADDFIVKAIIYFKGSRIKGIALKSSKNLTKKLPIDEIKIKNRAGNGSNIMLIVLDDYLENISIY
ncbi:MAG TPA: DNA topoisomerase IV subunit A [Clostridiaceae bacterium]